MGSKPHIYKKGGYWWCSLNGKGSKSYVYYFPYAPKKKAP